MVVVACVVVVAVGVAVVVVAAVAVVSDAVTPRHDHKRHGHTTMCNDVSRFPLVECCRLRNNHHCQHHQHQHRHHPHHYAPHHNHHPRPTIITVKACDCWSIGVIAYMLLSGMAPFMAPSDEGVKLKIKWAKVRINAS